MRSRIALGTIGALIMAYGAWRLLGTAGLTRPRTVGEWLIAALILHDGVLVPVTMTLGFVLNATLGPRARRYVAGALVAAALVTVVALPLIYRRGTVPPSTTLETQNYGSHLALIVALIAVVSAGSYAVRALRDRRVDRVSDTNDRPPTDHSSSSP
jgi:hypothetical protein